MIKDHITLPDVLFSPGTLGIKTLKMIDLILGTAGALFIRPKSKKNRPQNPSRILIIRPGGIGDAIFLLPILKFLKNNNRTLHIDILCERRNCQVFLSQPHIVNKTYIYTSLKDLLSVLKNSYDILIDTEQWHYLSALLGCFIRCDHSTGFASRSLRERLFSKSIPYEPFRYELLNFINLFADLLETGHQITRLDNSFLVPKKDHAWASQLVPEKACVLSLAASTPQRRLQKEQILSLIPHLLDQFNHIFLVGGKDTVALAKNILKKLPGQERIHDLTGQCSLAETAALIEKSDLTIGSDSGILHLARAIGSKTLTVFGPGNHYKWADVNSKHRMIRLDLPCSPCTSFGYTLPTCKDAFSCIRDLTAQDICKELPR